MCMFPSWIEAEDGTVYFLTDKDILKYLRTHPEKQWEDMIGHSAIKWVMPEVSGKDEEGFPCPPQVACTIMAGKCKRMMRVVWYKHLSFNEAGELHSFNDQPARIWVSGKREWRKNGELHRGNDKPARILANGTQEWRKNGELHRGNDQPAVIWPDGARKWWWHGELHRGNDQPARIWADGTREWWWHGKRHRENDQPAVIRVSGTQEWWRDGKYLKTERD